MGVIQFVKDVGRRLAVGDTRRRRRAPKPRWHDRVRTRGKQPHSCGWSSRWASRSSSSASRSTVSGSR
jgi:hypothetical protein